VQLALRAQQDLLKNDLKGYLRHLERFFRLGIRQCHLLWYVVIVGLTCFCREVDTCHSQQVGDMILRDSTKWKGLPSYLRDLLLTHDGLALGTKQALH